MSAWIWLTIAILFEVFGTTLLKISAGFTKIVPAIFTFIFYSACFYTLALALKTIDLGIAYAIWAGLGTALIACIGIFYFHESVTPLKIISFFLIIIGVIGLHLSNGYCD